MPQSPESHHAPLNCHQGPFPHPHFWLDACASFIFLEIFKPESLQHAWGAQLIESLVATLMLQICTGSLYILEYQGWAYLIMPEGGKNCVKQTYVAYRAVEKWLKVLSQSIRNLNDN